MSSDDEDDLFGDDGGESDDTADLLAAANKSKPAAKKKAAPKKKTAAKAKPKDDDSDSDGGLFDSDSDSNDDNNTKTKAKGKKADTPPPKALSKRERLEALAKRKKGPDTTPTTETAAPKEKTATARDESGYDSGDSYDSATFQRTEDDYNFIDTTGEDENAVNELYAEQNFDDERPDGYEDRKKKKKRRYDSGGGRGGDDRLDNADLEPDNPVMAAVHRMKKKKREKKTLTEVEDEVKIFLNRMEQAAEDDELAIKERRPATKKLSMLGDVCDMLTRRDMQRALLDFDLLTLVKRWIQPLPSGTLGNVTVRQRLLDSVSKMTGDSGVTATDLKRSELGKTVMVLYKHRSETPTMKRLLKTLVEQWSRPIFQKSGNMRDLERVHGSRGDQGLAALSKQQHVVARHREKIQNAAPRRQDVQSLIAKGKQSVDGMSAGVNRVRVPYSKGFHYSVRPAARGDSVTPEKRSASSVPDNRGKLSKRMVEKGRTAGKNQRSANISIEGRATK